jgi:hypothetical protein
VTEDDPLKANVLEMLGTHLSSISTIAVVGRVLGSDSVRELVARVEGEDSRNMKEDRRDNDICK